jgi:hypothetical protein
MFNIIVLCCILLVLVSDLFGLPPEKQPLWSVNNTYYNMYWQSYSVPSGRTPGNLEVISTEAYNNA